MDFFDPEKTLNLSNIRSTLIRMEDTILFHLIERAQFYHSAKVYKRDAFESLGNMSFLEWILRKTESVHSQLRRYQYPDENPFYEDALLPPVIPTVNYPPVLAGYSREINVNKELLSSYVRNIVPEIAAGDREEPENYGSCTLSDIQVLQSLSRRIHFGKFVAEAKYQGDREGMAKVIREGSEEGILNAIINTKVEQEVLQRIREKAEKYTSNSNKNVRWPDGTPGNLKPEVVVSIYQNCIIPLTKKVEVDYLLRRLDDEK